MIKNQGTKTRNLTKQNHFEKDFMYNIDKNIKISVYQKYIFYGLKKKYLKKSLSKKITNMFRVVLWSSGTYNCTDKNSCVIFKRSLKNEDDPDSGTNNCTNKNRDKSSKKFDIDIRNSHRQCY